MQLSHLYHVRVNPYFYWLNDLAPALEWAYPTIVAISNGPLRAIWTMPFWHTFETTVMSRLDKMSL